MPTYTSYSGHDITCVFRFPDFMDIEPMVFGELNTLSYSIYRDKFPVRALGYVNPKGYTKGSRTIAGSFIFTVFEKPIINKVIKNIYKGKQFNLIPDEIPPFSITVTMANELGAQTKLALYGVQIVEGNQIMTINDMQTNEQYSYVAQDIDMIDIESKEIEEPKEELPIDEDELETTQDTSDEIIETIDFVSNS